MEETKPLSDFVAQCPRIFQNYGKVLEDRNNYFNKRFALEWADDLTDKWVVEAGCGDDSMLNRCQPPLQHVLGLDPLLESLHLGPHMGWKVQGVVEEIPFRAETFDAIYCDSVFEHIQDPKATCREFYRVLKPGGKVLINTNSIFNPFMFPNKFLSMKFRKWVKKNILHMNEWEIKGTYPAPYRANTKARLKRYLLRAGFRNIQFYRWGLPGMRRPKWVFALLLCMELLSEIPLFCGLKHRLMVTCEK